MKIYVIGSLRNEEIPHVARILRAAGHEVYDEWYSPGPEADDYWQRYEQARNRTYLQALYGRHADMVYANDARWLDWADAVVLVQPAGRSGHLELGWASGAGKLSYVLMENEPDRFDIMYRMCTKVVVKMDDLLDELGRYRSDP